MAPDLNPYLSKVIPKLKTTSLVWELVDKMMQQSRSIRIPKVSVWLWAWILTFTKWSQSLTFQVESGSWWSEWCTRADQLETHKYRSGSGPGPLLFQNAPNAQNYKLGVGAGGRSAAIDKTKQKCNIVDVALDLGPYCSKKSQSLKTEVQTKPTHSQAKPTHCQANP